MYHREKRERHDTMIKLPTKNLYYGAELPEGCKQCLLGKKMVLFTNSNCGDTCYYCPLSQLRRTTPIPYANERPIYKPEEVIEEAELMGSTGASMTGGDPIFAVDRMLLYGNLLKEYFGKDYHIHIYTRGTNANDALFKKIRPVVDEIRFHMRSNRDFKLVEKATRLNWEVGVEIPIHPLPLERQRFLKKIILFLDELKKKTKKSLFINLNELEYSETNYRELLKRGYKPRLDNPNAIDGSKEAAIEIIKWAEENADITVHFCPSASKDQVQLPRRLFNRAVHVAQPFDYIEEEGVHQGLLIRGVIRNKGIISIPKKTWSLLIRELAKLTNEPLYYFVYDKEKDQLLTNALLLDEYKDEILNLLEKFGLKEYVVLGISEEYPTATRLETEFLPIS